MEVQWNLFNIIKLKGNTAFSGQSTQNQFYCEVCKISISTEAGYALHEFSKKHCDNLLRVAKNKPVINKQKVPKTEVPSVPKEPPKVNVPAAPRNVAKYGYFVPGEVYDTAADSKKFNTEYDPYLQKFAENPLNKESSVVKLAEVPLLPTSNITSFKRKKKKKKIRACQICNITLLTVPEYEAHMRSPQHSWKLKMSGMGVSAHFVKASSDLHTVGIKEDLEPNDQCEADNAGPSVPNGYAGTSLSTIFPTLYCDVCELLLNSEQQFNAHVSGKSHNDNVQRKAKVKAKKQLLKRPRPNQLYCFSCKISLNNLYQYNEHKYGKKHKLKCRKLMKRGITIPPEERVASWGMPRIDPSKRVIYPEMYEKYMLTEEKDIKCLEIDSTDQTKDLDSNETCSETQFLEFPNTTEVQHHTSSEEQCLKIDDENTSLHDSDEKITIPRMVFHKEEGKIEESKEIEDVQDVDMTKHEPEGNKYELNILGVNDTVMCSICCQHFTDQTLFDSHTTTEEHYTKILEIKAQGSSDNDILEMLFKDKTRVKPDRLGMYYCSICSITTDNAAEFQKHVSSLVHKKSEEDYMKKRRIELKSLVNRDEKGKFFCRLCQESSSSLVEFNDHLRIMKHRERVKAEKMKNLRKRKKSLLLQKKKVKQKYIISGLKKTNFACWRKKCRNPGVRTKIAGVARDLNTGMKADIPNLEPLEPKIDSAKNVSIGLVTGEKSDAKSKPHVKRKKRGRAKSYRSNIEPLMKEPRSLSMGQPTNTDHRRQHVSPSVTHTRYWKPYSPIYHQ